MCRWLAYSGSPIRLEELLVKRDRSLIDQSLHSREGATPTNGDGFGVGWYEEGEPPRVYRSVHPAWNDRNLKELAAGISSHLFLAHIRASTGTAIQETNTHPFRYGNWLWMHNGLIREFPRMRRELVLAIDDSLFDSIEGTTDSETMFYLALTFGLESDPVAAVEQMVGFVERHRTPARSRAADPDDDRDDRRGQRLRVQVLQRRRLALALLQHANGRAESDSIRTSQSLRACRTRRGSSSPSRSATSRAPGTRCPSRTSGSSSRVKTSCGRSRRNTDLMRNVLALALGAVALVFVVAYRRVLGVKQRPSWPPPSDAVTPAGAQAATEAFAARGGTRPHDAALPFAWATAATIEPWAEGVNFFPKIFADVEAASSSVHILMFGWREGEVGKRMAALLERKLTEGVEVRVIVDGFGSRPYKQAREMFTGLAAAGAQIVVNDVFPPDRDGLYPDGQQVDWKQDEIGRADHRKLYVIDGAIAWTGGAGIEDHFENGGFHDVMVRVTGDVVRQAQAAFLTSFHGHDGPLPPELSSLFPEPADPGSTPIALAQVIPGGHVAASQAIAEQIDSARQRLDLMNPYVTDRSMIDRIVAAGQRGVQVRLVISQKSNNGQATAALKHRYPDLLDAGVAVWELPDTVVHAKVVVADDVVSFGTVNLDAWALYRNSEITMIARSAETAGLMVERLFEPDIARSIPGEPLSTSDERRQAWLWNKLSHLL